MILETERLVLRRFVLEDLDALFELYRNPEIRRYFPEGVLSFDQTKEELEWFLNGHPRIPELGLWATVNKQTGEFIGRCGLLPWKIEDRQEVEVAYLLGQKFWGQGFATEAALAIVQYAFGKLDLSRLICLIDPENMASVKVAKRIGMDFEQKADGIDGDGFPTLIYSISRDPSI
jgi:[ribosomal protein S5]-alanine N-acetyltransferase